jgi:hypothetical protein
VSIRSASVTLGALALAASLAAGCQVFGQAGPIEDLHDWSAVPLAADQRLATEALKSSVCRVGDDNARPTILLQDRRTAMSAAFLVAGANWSGSCLITVANGGSGGGGRGAALAPLAGRLVVDERSSGGLGSGSATLLGGRAADDVATIQVVLPSGQVVSASVGGGHWLAWWPGDVEASRVVALDSTGAVLQTLTDTTPGFQLK